MDNKIRLNKFISNSGVCSRRDADKYIKAGVVSVNNKVTTKMGEKISPNDIVKFNNSIIKSEKLKYLLLLAKLKKKLSYKKTHRMKCGLKNNTLSEVMRVCNKHLIPSVLCPWGESEYIHMFSTDETLSLYESGSTWSAIWSSHPSIIIQWSS